MTISATENLKGLTLYANYDPCPIQSVYSRSVLICAQDQESAMRNEEEFRTIEAYERRKQSQLPYLLPYLDVQGVENFLSLGECIDEKGVLMKAVERGDEVIVDILLDRTGGIRTSWAGHALEIAASRGHVGIVAKLLKQYHSTYCVTSALKNAVLFGHEIIATMLLETGAASLDDREWVLENAASLGHEFIVTTILDQRIISGWSEEKALKNAAKHGHNTIVAILLDKRPGIFSSTAGEALEYAASEGHGSIVTLLLDKRSDIFPERIGRALEKAASHGHEAIVTLLLEKRSLIFSSSARSALLEAAKNGHAAIATMLLDDKRFQFSASDTTVPLWRAAKNGHAAIVAMLLDKRSDISVSYAGIALLEAVKNGHPAAAATLLDKRSDISDDCISKALLFAAKYGQEGIVTKLLKSRDHISSFFVQEALQVAIQNGNIAIAIKIFRRMWDTASPFLPIGLIAIIAYYRRQIRQHIHQAQQMVQQNQRQVLQAHRQLAQQAQQIAQADLLQAQQQGQQIAQGIQQAAQAVSLANDHLFDLLHRAAIPSLLHDDCVLKQNSCPITYQPLRDPVKEPGTNALYERNAILKWLNGQGNPTSPLTRQRLVPNMLEECPKVRAEIDERLKIHSKSIKKIIEIQNQLGEPIDFEQIIKMLKLAEKPNFEEKKS